MSTAGQALGGLVGGVVGFVVSGGNPMGALYGAQAGIMVGGIIDPPKGPTINGPRLSDLSAQTSTYGSPIPSIYGTVATHGNVIWLQGNQLTERVRKEKQGGKGGGGGATVKTYSYFATFAVGLADVSKTGPIQGVRRIWVGGNLIYDAGSDDLETIIASNQAAQGFRIYFGDENQQPDPRMQADLGVANCPAYRGLAYIVFYDFALNDYGNSLIAAQVKVEVVCDASYSIVNVDNQVVDATQPHSNPDFRTKTYFVSSELVSSYVPQWSNNYPASSSFTKYSSFAGGSLVRESFATTGTDVPPNGSTDNPNEYWPSSVSAIPGAGPSGVLFASANGHVTKRDGVTVGISLFYRRLYVNIGDNFISSNAIAGCYYNGFVYAVEGSLVKKYTIDLVLVDSIQTLSGMSSSSLTAARAFPANGAIYFIPDNTNITIYRIDPDLSEITIVSATSISTSSNYATEYSVEGNLLTIAYGSANGGQFTINRYNLENMSSSIGELAEIIETECVKSGLLSSADVDVSGISQPVIGYRVSQVGSIRGAIEPLQGAWPFDVIQSGYKIKFVRRGKSPVVTIDATQLDARQADSAPGVQITLANEMDTQLPRAVSLKYFDIGREYDLSEQNAERLNTDAVNLREIEMPIVLSANEAAGMSEVLLYLYWLERRDVSFSLPPEYRYLEPADVITVTGEWGQYELRLTRINLESDGRLACSAKFNAAAIYTPTAQGAEGEAPAQTIPLDGPSGYIMLDVPLLSDSYNSPGWPAAMAGYTNGWPGGVIYRSVDGGQTWTDLQGFTSPVTMGYARGALGAGRFDIVDASSVLDVGMMSGDLSSIDEVSQFAGGNLCAYGAPGRWEICSPRTVTLNANGSLRMTDWLRGRFGTELAASLHKSGDALVLLTDPDLAWVGMESGAIGLPRDYRGITSGRAIDTDTSRSETYSGVNLKPLSPVYLNGSRHPSTRDWSLSWTRRGRVSPDWRSSVDVPLGEASEAYEVEIYDGSGYATVKRTLTASTPAAAYTSAQQVTDFGANQATLYVRVYQISATVGRGYPLTTSITRG